MIAVKTPRRRNPLFSGWFWLVVLLVVAVLTCTKGLGLIEGYWFW